MANCITRHIPNTITCLNLFSGCIASVVAFHGKFELALFFIFLSAVFDFFDGMAARLLDARSIIGKDIDSLADDVSFGFAPSVVVFSFLQQMTYPEYLVAVSEYIPYWAFLISVFSALRLAKFNNDTRQTTSFIGLPVPANALFWASLIAGCGDCLQNTLNPLWIMLLVCLFSWLLVSEIPMFSLKFKSLAWSANKVSYIFLLGCIPLLILLGISSFAAIIVWYLIVSVSTWLLKK